MEIRLVTLYTYHCVDGCVRTRCERHIEQSGPYAIVQRERAIYHRKQSKGHCVRCDWEAERARSGGAAARQGLVSVDPTE